MIEIFFSLLLYILCSSVIVEIGRRCIYEDEILLGSQVRKMKDEYPTSPDGNSPFIFCTWLPNGISIHEGERCKKVGTSINVLKADLKGHDIHTYIQKLRKIEIDSMDV